MTELIETFNKKGERISPLLPEGKKNFIIDVDGVVSEDIPNEEPERMITANEIEGSREQVNKWFNEGHIITFFTSRTEDLREVTEDWLNEHNFKYHKLLMGKPRGGNYHYVDDRVVRATRFKGKLSKLVKIQKEIEVFE